MWLVTDFSLLVVDSHPNTTHEDVWNAATTFPHNRVEVVRRPANPDYTCGHFHTLNATSELWRSFDLVLHINVDVVLTPDTNKLLRAHVEDERHTDAAFIVTAWRGYANAYNTDVFLFRPPLLPHLAFFGGVCGCNGVPTHTMGSYYEWRCVAETMFCSQIHRSTPPIAVYDMGRISRKAAPDKLGIWHTHDVEAVDAWMSTRNETIPLGRPSAEIAH